MRGERNGIHQELRSRGEELIGIRDAVQNLERRRVGMETRLATEVTAIVAALNELCDTELRLKA